MYYQKVDYNTIDFLQGIKRVREERKITQAEVAERLGMSRASYNQLENGNRKVTLDDIADVARVLNVSTDYLLYGDNEVPALFVNEFCRLDGDEQAEIMNAIRYKLGKRQ